MKASRAAVRTAKGLDELATEVAEIREQLNRMEDELPGKISILIEEAIALMLAGSQPDAVTQASAKAGIKTPAKTQKKGG